MDLPERLDEYDRATLLLGAFAVIFGLSTAVLLGYTVLDGGVPAVGTDNPSKAEFDFPRGTNDTTIHDPQLMLKYHDATLTSKESFTVAYTVNHTSPSKTYREQQHFAYNKSQSTIRYRNTGGEAEVEHYARIDTGVTYIRQAKGGNVSYQQRPLQSNAPVYTGRSYLGQRMTTLTYSFDSMDRVEGTPVAVYNVTGVVDKLEEQNQNFTITGKVYIDEDGIVRQLDLVVNDAKNNVHTEQHFEVINIGETTVQEPEWLGTAKREAAEG